MALAARQPDPTCEPLTTTDGELVMRFVRRRDRAAIGELVEKHAPMVMAVCRQILGSRPDAEDAFQATFLILVRRAASIERKSSVAGWLYRVAHRTAMRLARRRRRRKVEPIVEEPVGDYDVFSIIHQRELQWALHEELKSLPARYRDPIVLMYFAEMSREQIAEELECTDAAVKGRLARGRKVLRLALARRGVGLSVALGACVAAVPVSAAALPALVDKTVLACTSLLAGGGGAASVCSTQSLQLAKEGVRAMTISMFAKTMIAPAVLGIAVMAVAQIPLDPPEALQNTTAAGDELSLADTAAASEAATSQLHNNTASVEVAAAAAAEPPSTDSADSASIGRSARGAAANTPGGSQIGYRSGQPPALANAAIAAGLPEATAALSPNLTELDAASLQMLEEYYLQRAKASRVRQEAKALEMRAYQESGTARERALDKAREMDAQADIVELRADADLFAARAKLLHERREQMQAPDQTETPAATLAPGDRVLVRLHVSATDPSLNLNEIARVEAGGTLPLGPILGRVQVAGKTLQEAEDEVRKAAARHYRDAAVQITHASDPAAAQP